MRSQVVAGWRRLLSFVDTGRGEGCWSLLPWQLRHREMLHELGSRVLQRDKWLLIWEERQADSPFITPQCHYSQIFRKTNSTNGMKKVHCSIMNIFYYLVPRLSVWKANTRAGAEWTTNAFKLNHWLQWKGLYLGILGKSMTWRIEKKIDSACDANPPLTGW